MGRSEGICHVYVDTDASIEKATWVGKLLEGDLDTMSVTSHLECVWYGYNNNLT